jgi:hypothetical protein
MTETADPDPAALLAPIRADIEETVYVYSLDGAGKSTHPVSAAMSRHARSLLAAVDAALSLAHRLETAGPPVTDLVDRYQVARMFREAVQNALAEGESGNG